ncbi:unnamed protein product [Protopolystoma xenopodis]|uniref:Phosphatidylserine synthase n=1 Tax=Protopolystoma xenopodis TaxID=117903 RepID=A0A3S5AHL3_9PLAT|nr:unnamed protein product [Protopolystoma xenopodis]
MSSSSTIGFILSDIVAIFGLTLTLPGPFTRPHPLVWRVIFGASLLYFLSLVFAIFLGLEDTRRLLVWMYPNLLSPDDPFIKAEYGVNCSQVSPFLDVCLFSASCR